MTREKNDNTILMSRREKVSNLVEKLQSRMAEGNSKISVADFIRLVQLERDLRGEERPREMKVTWSEPSETSDTGE